MSFSPDALRKHLSKHGDLAKPSRFRATITGFSDIGRDLRLQCEATELPGFTVNTSEAKIYGPSWHVATIPVFTDVQLTFICTQDMWEKKFFDDWMKLIVPIAPWLGTQVSPHVGYRDDYMTNIFIEQMTEVNQTLSIYRCVLEEAFPTTVAALPVSWADVDGVHRLQVTFKYTRWKPWDTNFTLTDYAEQFNYNQGQPPPVQVQDGPINIPETKIEPDFIDPFVTPPSSIPVDDIPNF